MFESNFVKCENSLKRWAKFFMIAACALMVLCILAALILLALDAEELWIVAISLAGGGILLALSLVFVAHLTWGFAEIVENTKKIAKGEQSTEATPDDVLPEL